MSHDVASSGLLDTDLELIVLNRLRKLEKGESLTVREVAKRNPDGFIEVVKRLIRCGWCEYEFSNDYSMVKRLDLPEFARNWFREQRTALKLNKNETELSTEYPSIARS